MLGLMFAMPFISAATEHSDNSIGIASHWISMVLIVVVIVFAFMAAGMFAEGLGKAMKLIGVGMAFLGINSVMEEFAHMEFLIIPEGVLHSLTYHGLVAVAYIFLAYGFYRVYKVAKGVSGNSVGKSVQKGAK